MLMLIKLCEESEKKHLGVDLQVKSVMECMLNSMDFEVTITTGIVCDA